TSAHILVTSVDAFSVFTYLYIVWFFPAYLLTDIADILNRQGEKQKAINTLNQALNIQRQIKTRPAEATTLLTLGDVYFSLGAYPESLNVYKQALDIWQIIGDRSHESDTLSKIADVYRKSQTYPQAMNYYQQALSVSKNTGNCRDEAFLLGRISRNYLASGDYQQAISVGNQAIALSRNLEVDEYKLALEAATLHILAQVEIKQGNYSKSLESSQKARKLGRESGFREIEANVIAGTGEAYAALKQPEKAIEAYKEQLALYTQMGLPSEQAQSLYNIAKLQRQNNQLQAANTEIDRAINIIEEIRKEVVSSDLRTSFFATVQDYYQLKIDILMELHKKDPSKVCEFNIQDLKIKDRCDALALHISERSRARGLVELLTEANVDIRKGVDPTLLAEERQLRWRIDARDKQLSELLSKKESPAQLVTITKQQIEGLLKQQQELKTKFRNTNSEYAALKYPQPLTLPQIQQQLDQDSLLLQYSLGEERSYLWVVTPNSLNSYELPNSEKIKKAAINLNQQLKSPLIAGASAEEKAQAVADTTKAAQELSQLIIAPVASKLGQKRLVIVPDGILHQIPFAVLSDLTPQPPSLQGKREQDKLKLPSPLRRGVGGEVNYQPLLVNHEIINLPSVTSLATQRQQLKGRKMASKTIAVLADPVFSTDDCRVTGKAPENSSSVSSTDDCKVTQKATKNSSSTDIELERSALERSLKNINRSGLDRLPGTRDEAEAVLKMVSPSESFRAFDFDANYNLATSKQLSQYRLLLFATHGIFDNINPELSGIAMSLVDKQGKPQKGFLRLNDIFNLDLPAELIVLSACESGLGQEVKGEGLVGLTRGLMYAGSPRVIVSLWKVNDQATSLLMQELYKQILQQDKSPAVALREAQLKLWQQPEWQNPRYWAAFTMQGEWRNNYSGTSK
ncbi:CHAT domain-containing protein, partial [Nostoc sp.]|uniref:CHAT domain-containing protein n=1 Tax=Nostoc sp. TaxID=1180 RepID=UPI002FFB435C